MLRKIVASFLLLALAVPSGLIQAIEYDPDFNPNHFISDYEMFDYDSMSLGEIQAFLDLKDGFIADWTTEDKNGELKTPAEIIFNASQEHKVSPKTLIVLLQKEQGLIQNASPTQKRLDWATGYAVCDSCKMSDPRIQKFKGFGKQVDHAASALRFYTENAHKHGFIKKKGESYTITGQTVIPESQATGNLYTYTPHIRGNYTFWRVYQSYFGDPLSESRSEQQATTQTKYMAQIMDRAPELVRANEGEQAWYWVEYQNIGTETWYNDDLKQLFLIDSNATAHIPLIEEDSEFTYSEKLDQFKPVFSQRKSVAPGEVLRISIPVEPDYDKTESASYVLALNGHGAFADSDIDFSLERTFRYDAELIEHTFPEYGAPNNGYDINVSYKNVGTRTWDQETVRLQWENTTVKTKNRIKMNEKTVAPGETATFSFRTNLRNKDAYDYRLSLLKDVGKKYNQFPTGEKLARIKLSEGLAAQLIDFQVPENMQPGETYSGRVVVKNTGSQTWTKEEMVLRSYRTTAPYRRSHFHDASWISGFAIDKVQKDVKPGEVYTFTFKVEAPQQTGNFKHLFQLEWGDEYEEVAMSGEYTKKIVTTVSNANGVAAR
jgi:hypothetical protein